MIFSAHMIAHDKGKPAVRQGRKAESLWNRLTDSEDRLVTESDRRKLLYPQGTRRFGA